jgi:hypothetical protein
VLWLIDGANKYNHMNKTSFILKNSKRMIAALALAVAVVGSSAGDKNPVVVELATVQKGVAKLRTCVADTASALDAVKNAAKAGGDLKAPNASFSKQLTQLEEQITTLRGQATQMRARADDHYKAWQAEVTKMGNPKLREKAQNRFADAKDEFEAIITTADEAKRNLVPYVADLRDIASYLNVDLSVDAVKSLSGTIWRLGNKANSVLGSIDDVSKQIGKALETQPQS